MKKQDKVLSFLAFVAFSAMFLILLYFLIGKSVLKFTQGAENEFKARQARLLEVQELVRSLPNPEKAAEELERTDAALKEIRYDKKQLPKLIQWMAKAAADAGVEVITIRPRDDLKASGPVPPGVNRVPMELVLYCEYKGLAEYLQALAAPPYSFFIESLTLSKRETGGEDGSKGRVPLEAVIIAGTYMVWE